MEANKLAAMLDGYVVESLSGTDTGRRALAVRAASVHQGMLVPSTTDEGYVEMVPVLGRREIGGECECFDLEVEDLGTFVVNGVVVHNCVYAFRGADEDAVPGLIRALRAKTLPLSITYRCPRAVVRLAQTFVPDLEAAPDAPEGVVDYAGTRARLLEQAAVGDMVISRTNAPLIGLCLGLLKQGRRASIMGRNIGEGLVKAIKDSKTRTVEALEEYMEGWCLKETARLLRKKRDPQEALDKKECVLALCEDADSVKVVLERAERLFTDATGEAKVLLGTTHKLKGLEASTVWMLDSTYRREKGGEEIRIWYVAVTRAKHTLIMTKLPKERCE